MDATHHLPAARPSNVPGSDRRQRILAVLMSALLSMGLISVTPAPAGADHLVPFECSGQVWINNNTGTVAGNQLHVGTFQAEQLEFALEGEIEIAPTNAMGFWEGDGFLYAIDVSTPNDQPTRLIRIGQDGEAHEVNEFTNADGGSVVGTVAGDNYWFRQGSDLQRLPMAAIAGGGPFTANTTPLQIDQLRMADFDEAAGYLWGGVTDEDQIVRITPGTGAVDIFDAPFLEEGTIWPAAIAFGNDNIGLVSANTGMLYRFEIDNPDSATPTFELITSQPTVGPATNDGTSCFSETDLSLTKTGPAAVGEGSFVSYTLRITNESATPASGWSLVDDVPSQLTDLQIQPSADHNCVLTTVAGQPRMECTGGGISPGGFVDIVLGGTAPNTTTGLTLTNNATVFANDIDTNPGNDDSQAVTQVNPAADLAVSKTGPAEVAAGGSFTYTVTVENLGPGTALNAQVSDPLPEEVTFVGASDGGVHENGTVTWNLGDMADGAVLTRTVEATAPLTGTSFTNTATASSDTTDPNPGNDTGESDPTTVTAEADLEFDKTCPTTIPAGQAFACTLSVVNNGPSTAQDVDIEDTVQSGFTFVDGAPTTPGWVDEGGSIVWELGAVPAGESRSVAIGLISPADPNAAAVNVAAVTSPTADPDPSDNSDEVAINVTASANVSITKTGDTEVDAGGAATWVVTATNDGPSTADDVVVTDTLPAGFVFQSASPQAPTSTDGNTLTWNFGSVGAGGVRQLTINATAPAAPAQVTNTATVATSTAGDDPGDNNASLPVAVTASADVSVAKSSPPGPVDAGTETTFTITATNAGPSSAESVVVTDDVPAGWTIVDTHGGTQTGPSQVQWNVGTLTPGANVAVQITLRAPAEGSTGAQNTATVSSPTPDPNPDNDTASTDPITVTAISDVSVAKSGPTTIEPGTLGAWTLRATNAGPSTATDVVVQDLIPAGFTFVSASDGGTEVSPGVVQWNLGTVAPDAFVDLTVTLLAPNEPVEAALNTATISSSTEDPQPGNNQSQVETDVPSRSAITLTKTGDSTVVAAQPIEYQITATNAGPSTAQDVTVTEALPEGFGFMNASAGGIYDEASHTVSWTVETFPVTTLDFSVVLVAPDEPTTGQNTVSVACADPEACPEQPPPAPVNTEVTAFSAVTVSKAGPSTVVAAQPVEYQITATNSGPSTATGVTVTDDVPDGFTFVSASDGGVYDAASHTVTWRIEEFPEGPLPPFTLVLQAPDEPTTGQNTATVACDVASECAVTDSDPVNTEVTAFSDLTLVKNGPDTVEAATEFDYTLTVTNAGPSTSTGAVVTDALPPAATYVTDDGGCTENEGTLTCELDPLASGGEVTITVTVIAPDQAQDLVNTASLGCTEPPTCAITDPEPVHTEVTPISNLELTKTAPESVDAASEFDYVLTLTNHGPSDAADVAVSDTLPSGLTYVTDDQAGVHEDGTITWQFALIPAGETRTITLTVLAPDEGGDLENAAVVSCATPDHCPDPIQPEPVPTDVDPLSDLHLVLDGPAVVEAAEEFTYEIEVTNLGPSTAIDVLITQILSDEVTYISHELGEPITSDDTAPAEDSGPATMFFRSPGVLAAEVAGGATGLSENGDPLATLDALAPDELVTMTVTVAAPDEATELETTASTEMTCEPGVEVDCPTDPDITNNSMSMVTETTALADVELVKTSDSDVVGGEEFTYTVEVTNHGPSTATGVTVTDDLPSGLAFVSDDSAGEVAGSTVTWHLGTMAPGEIRVINMVVATPESGIPGAVVNLAEVSANEEDPNPDNNTDESPPLPIPAPDESTEGFRRDGSLAYTGLDRELVAAGIAALILGLLLASGTEVRSRRRRAGVGHTGHP